MIICSHCNQAADMYKVDNKVRHLKGLKASHFHVCEDCFDISEDQCEMCGGATFIPHSKMDSNWVPTICPDCRHEKIEDEGFDPGWKPEVEEPEPPTPTGE